MSRRVEPGPTPGAGDLRRVDTSNQYWYSSGGVPIHIAMIYSLEPVSGRAVGRPYIAGGP